jgi:hypothetical protein
MLIPSTERGHTWLKAKEDHWKVTESTAFDVKTLSLAWAKLLPTGLSK